MNPQTCTSCRGLGCSTCRPESSLSRIIADTVNCQCSKPNCEQTHFRSDSDFKQAHCGDGAIQ